MARLLKTNEFVSSLQTYVTDDNDRRPEILSQALVAKSDEEFNLFIPLMAVYDLAALFTFVCAVINGTTQIHTEGFGAERLRDSEDFGVRRVWGRICKYIEWAWTQPSLVWYFEKSMPARDGEKATAKSTRVTGRHPESSLELVRRADRNVLVAALRTGQPTGLALRTGDIFDVLVGDFSDPDDALVFMEDNFTPARRASLMEERYTLPSTALLVASFDDCLFMIARLVIKELERSNWAGAWEVVENVLFQMNSRPRPDLEEFFMLEVSRKLKVRDLVEEISTHAYSEPEWSYILGEHCYIFSTDRWVVGESSVERRPTMSIERVTDVLLEAVNRLERTVADADTVSGEIFDLDSIQI